MEPGQGISSLHRDLLLEISLLVSEQREIDEIFATFADHVRQGAAFEHASLLVITPDPGFMRLVGNIPQFSGAWPPGRIIPVADTGAEAALNQRDGTEYRPELVETVATQGLAKEGFQRCWVMPLYIDDVLCGVLTVGKRARGPFAESDLDFLRAAGALLARTVHQSIELERAKRGEARAEAARELVLALQSGEPIEQIFERLPALLKDCLAVDYVGLFLQQGTVFPAVAEAPDHIYMGLPPDEAGAEFARAAAAGFDVSQGRIKVDGPHENPLAEAGYQRGAMAFLRDGSELRGLLVMARRSRRRFDPGELTFMELLRSVLAQSLINRQQVARVEGATARARTLNDVALLLSRTDDLGASFDKLIALLRGAIEFDYAGLSEVIEPGAMRQVAARPEITRQDGSVIPNKEARLASLLALEGMSQFSLRRYAGESAFTRTLRDAGMARVISIALVSGGEAQGVLALARRNGARFAPEEEEFLRTLASMLGQAMEANSRLRRAETEAARQALLRDLASQMATGQSLEAFFDVLAPEVQRAISVTGMVLLAATSAPGELRVVRGLRGVTFPDGRLIHRDDIGVNMLGQFAAGATVVEGVASDLGGRVAEESHASGTQRGAVAVIRAGAEDVGYLLIGRDVDSPFLADERRFIELISALAGQVIANLRATEAERAQASRRRVLNDLALIVNDGEPIESHFARVCELLAGEGYTFFALTARNSEDDGFRLLRSMDLPGDDGLPHPERIDAMLETGLRHVQFGAATAHPQLPVGLFETGIGRAATLVLSAGNRTKGLLTIGKPDPAPFTDEEMTFFELAGTLVAYAIASERRIAATTAEAEEQAILATAAAAIARETAPLAITRALRGAAGLFIHDPYVTFGFLEPGVVEFVTRTGPLHPMAISKWFTRAFAEGQVVVPPTAERVRAGEVIPEVQATGVQSHVLTTVTSGDSVVGLLVIGSRDENFVPGDRELRLCRLIAHIAGPALANARIAQRKQLEAKDQQVLAEVGAVASRESTLEGILLGLKAPLEALISQPLVLFGFREPDAVAFPVLGGEVRRVPLGPYAALLDEKGQLHADAVPAALLPGGLGPFRLHAINATAVRSAGATIGYFIVGSRDGGFRFDERTLEICRRVGQVVGPAMENARATFRSRQEADEQRFLADTAAAAARATQYQDLLSNLWRPFQRFVPGALTGFVFREGDVIYDARSPGVAIPLPIRVAEVMEQEQSSDRLDEHLPGTRTYDYFHSLGIASWVDTTVAIQGEKIGLFFLGTTDPGYRFTERDLRLCRLTAGIIGPAMANLRESQRRQQDADDQRILAEAAAAAATGDTERAILKALVEPIRSFIPDARITFSYVEGDDIWQFDGNHRRAMAQHSRLVFETGQQTGDIETTPITEGSRTLMEQVGTRRWVDTVAHSGGARIGVLWVGTPGEYEFSERDLSLLRLIADVTGPAMVNAREAARRQQEAEDEHILSQVAALAARSSLVVDILEGTAAALAALIPGAYVNYGILNENSITYVWNPGDAEAEPVTYEASPAGLQAIAQGQATGHFADLPDRELATRLGLHRFSVTLHTSAGAPAGMLAAASSDPDYEFPERTLALLRRITQVVGPAIEAARAEAERTRQAELNSLILRSLSEGVVLSDANGDVIFANAFGRAIVDAIDPEGLSESWQDVLHRLPEEVRDGYRAVFEEGKGSRGRTHLSIAGEERWLDYEFVPLDDPHMRFLLVAADVTADVGHEAQQRLHREQMEQAQRLAALGELIGGVAHELNNPLTAILGFSEVLGLSKEAEPFREDLSVIQKEALRARNIVRDLLFIARPGTSERRLIPVSELVDHIERLRRTGWKRQEIEWDIRIPLGCEIWGNEHQLTQVILNLVTNAEQAMQAVATRHLRISAATRDGRTEIKVSDSGIGMDEATRNRIFEPFFTTKQGHGTGLGMSLSYSIIRAHEGEFRVDSAPGEGAAFTISIPFPPAPAAPTPAAEDEPAADVIKVLVVDDEPSLRKVCQRLITSMGHHCHVAENTAAALKQAAEHDFDVILCDYRLGAESADDVVAGLLKAAPKLVERVVIVTGATTDAGVIALTEKHNLRIIAKPYGVEDLSKVLQRAT